MYELKEQNLLSSRELTLAKSDCVSDHFHRVNQILRHSDLSQLGVLRHLQDSVSAKHYLQEG